MANLLYLFSNILIFVWAVAVAVYGVQGLIHLLPALAFAFMLLRYILWGKAL